MKSAAMISEDADDDAQVVQPSSKTVWVARL
jgi:hypothetical protein